jgi:hypothetical protein
MLFEQVELYGIEETLRGDGVAALPPAARTWLAESNGLAAWEAIDASAVWVSRIPETLRHQLNPQAQLNALQATGAEIRFILQGEPARIVLQCPLGPGIVEVYQGAFLSGWHLIGHDPTEIVINHPPRQAYLEQLGNAHGLAYDSRLTRVVLPWRPPVRIVAIDGACAPPTAEQVPAGRLLMYGSSITHGNCAIRPTATYAARTAQLLGMELINLGFGGGAHLERAMADYIAAQTEWDVATLEMGINLLEIEVEEFARRVAYFINTIAAAHPGKPILCQDVFLCHDDVSGNSKAAAFRQVVRKAVISSPCANLTHVPGLDILSTVDELTTDLVHPSPNGMEEMARRLSCHIAHELALPRSESDPRD